MMFYLSKLLLIILIGVSSSLAQSITFNTHDAVVWSREQIISGKLNDFYSNDVKFYLNGNEFNSTVSSVDSTFSITVNLAEGINSVVAVSNTASSDTLKFTLGYNIKPEVYAYATVNGNDVILHASVIVNPDTSTLSFQWIEDSKNPISINISNSTDTAVSFTMNQNAPLGEYYFNLFTYSSKGDTVKSRTFITVDSNSIKPFDIKTDHAAWIDSAIIYEITPYNFTENGKFDLIKTKIPELAELGVTTIWLQPVYKTYYGGQGYDVTNYFEVRNDLGTTAQLKSLIQRAKDYGLRVLFDFAANHSSIQHPYAVESSQLGEQSHYYNFYQREEDNASYSQHYQHYNGFINYFWDDLPNLNYDNPEVRKWITEAAKYWIKNFDIDGFRFDAIWGVNARDPQFAKDLRLELKRIKPEILMIAEDKATWPSVFDERFDVAYDWAPGEDWVSQWVWSYDYSSTSNPTIFNSGGVNNRSAMLRNSLNNNGNGYARNAKILRFMENNDTFHFITHHNLAQTKMVAALMFSLNGIPLIYNGQEIGISGHPYSIDATFQTSQSIQSQDQYGLFNYYKRLTELRTLLPSLRSENFAETSISPNKFIFAYRRWSGNQNVFCALNMSGANTNAELTIPMEELNLDSSKTYYLTDMINGEIISGKPEELSTVNMTIDGYTTKMFLLADTAMTVTSVNDNYVNNSPKDFELQQNYPNPFNPITTINFILPESGNITLKIYNSIGEEVMSLQNGFAEQGLHSIKFDGKYLSSGVYFYQLRYNNNVITKKMMLLK